MNSFLAVAKFSLFHKNKIWWSTQLSVSESSHSVLTVKFTDGMADQKQGEPHKYQPGDGIRSMRTTTLFRTVNFELYAKPNIVIMGIGLTCFGVALGYMAYMRSKYESLGYYAAVQNDGTEVYTKKHSKWDK